MSNELEGWSVRITSVVNPKRSFFCANTYGILPPVWGLSQRKYAVQHKRELIEQGFKAKVVRVRFTQPVESEGKQ